MIQFCEIIFPARGVFILLNFSFSLVLSNSLYLNKENHPHQNPVPYALSPTYLTYLARHERKIYHAMKDYTKALEERLKLLKRYTEDYEETSVNGTSFTEENEDEKDNIIASNPILSYRMLSRYSNEFSAIGGHINENAESVSSEIVFQAKGPYDFPSISDAKDAIEGILRMQFMYNLKTENLADGQITGVKNPVGLNTNQCYQIAKAAQGNHFYTLALEWFNVTRARLKVDKEFLENPEFENTLNEKNVENDIRHTVSEHNREFQENYDEGYEYIYTSKIKTLNLDTTPPKNRDYLLNTMSGLRLNESDPNYYLATYIDHIALCNGANLQTPLEKAKLRCWYDRQRNPYWAINPLKMELLNSNPPVVQMYDVLSTKWMSYFQKLAYPSLERAPLGPNATPRTAAYAWFKDFEIPEAPISKRIEFITGLNVIGTKASEALQIAAYAFGGHVELHYDSKGPDDPNPDSKGDRVTTFLAYLNDVNFGGHTSFPKLGFFIKPVKGSAVLWYTNLKNGAVDSNTIHGACPLVYGHKWIATKWTHINENIFKRPCGLSPSV